MEDRPGSARNDPPAAAHAHAKDPSRRRLDRSTAKGRRDIGKQFNPLVLGAFYYVEKSDLAQEWDLRAVVSVVFP